MTQHKTLSAAIAAIATCFCLTAHADGATITKDEAKDLKTQSEAQYKARKKVAEANEDLNKADCKAALDGAAQRACEKSAKATAKSQGGRNDAAPGRGTAHQGREEVIARAT